MSKRTIQDIEQELEELEFLLATPLLALKIWSPLVSRMHALHIRLSHMRGEALGINEFKSDHII